MTPLLQVDDLQITFQGDQHVLKAVKSVSFSIQAGKTLAIVGESGSGKSVTALAITQLLPPAPQCVVSGSIRYKQTELLKASPKELRSIRGKEIAYIFQEPATSLNPVFTIGYQIAEAVKLHLPHVNDVKARVIEALTQVGIKDPAKRYYAYPHELSGGMQQRVMIAMALVCEPSILIADEPTTALDVTIQKQIIDLLKTIKASHNMSILMITHNFGIIKDFAEDVLVMYRGEVVEYGPVEKILYAPEHPYTKALIACIPQLGQKKHRLTTIDYNLLGTH